MSNTKITPSVKAKITWLNDDPSGAKKAAATITIAEAFQVHGVSIVEGPKGLFISMPQRQTTDKKFLEVAHPVTAEMRKAIHDAVFGAYSQTLAVSNQYKNDFQKDSDSAEVKSSQESAKDRELPFEVASDETEDSEAESEEEVDAPIMGQIS